MITGTTDSKLLEIKRYNSLTPYVIGINGVIEVTDDYVVYIIGDITYKTFFKDESTYFSYHLPSTGSTLNLSDDLVVADDSINFNELKDIDNKISVTRNNYPVFELFSKVSKLRNINDINLYPSNYFTT